MARTERNLHLAVSLDGPPRAAALSDSILVEIAAGRLGDGDWLPATRRLAEQLRCSRTLVTSSYDELIAAGFLIGVPGSGTRVSPGAVAAARAGARSHVPSGRRPSVKTTGDVADRNDRRDVQAGRADGTLIDARAWRGCVRDAAAEFGRAGAEHLGSALREHLRRHRGVIADEVIVVPRSSSGFALAAHAARAAGVVDCFVEAPCYGPADRELRRAGFRPEPVRVDSDGLCVEELPERRSVVYVTPAHQFPLGHRMSAARRMRLVDWALRTGSLIIEDDYDGEFRYDVAPLPALRSLAGAQQCVAYVGTSSKILVAGLGVAWLLPPESLAAEMRDAAAAAPWAVPSPVAAAIARFVEREHLAGHLARAGRVYRDRRNVLVEALTTQCPGIEVLGVEAGLHVTVLFDGDDARACAILAESGWRTRALSSYPHADVQSGRGLVVGYSRIDRHTAREFAIDLARVVEAVATR